MFGLEFAPGTTEDCKKLVSELFEPSDILGAYRMARERFKTSDIAIVVSEKDPSGFNAMTRIEFAKRLREMTGRNAAKLLSTLTMAQRTAHNIVQLPSESEAMWLVIDRGRENIPVTCVIFTTPYEISN